MDNRYLRDTDFNAAKQFDEEVEADELYMLKLKQKIAKRKLRREMELKQSGELDMQMRKDRNDYE